MKNKLLFSTALVAASLSFAMVANAEIFINNQTALDNLEDETSGVISFDNLAESTDLGTLTLNSDKQVNGQVTLHDRVTLLNGIDGDPEEEDGVANFHVTGWLTETAPGSDTSAIRIGVGNGGLVLGNNLKTGSADLRDDTDIVLYYSEDEAEGLGQYAINPEKTLETIGHIRIENGTTHVRASRDGEGQDEDKDLETKTSLLLNGTGSVVVEGDATLQVDRKTTFNIDVMGDPDEEDNEGAGKLIANADIINNATIANNVTVNAGATFENNGVLSGVVTNNGKLTSAFDGLTGEIENGQGGELNVNGGGTLRNAINNNGTFNMQGDYVLGEEVTLGGINNIDGSLDLAGKVLNGDITLADGSSLAFTFGSEEKVNGEITLAGDAELKATIANGTKDGTHQFANSVSGNGAWKEISNNLYDVSYTTEEGDENQAYLTIAKKSNEDIAAATGADANQANAVSAMIDGADTDNETFNEIAGGISEMLQSDDEAVKKAALDTLTVMAPDVAPIVQRNAIELNNQIFGAVGTRMSGGAVAAARQGVASGDSISNNTAVWMQGLFNKAELDDRGNVKGFDAKTYGAAFGLEKQINNKVKAGIGYAYSETDVDAYKRDIDVDTHSAFVYGEYKPSKWFVNAAAAYSWSDYSESKNVAGAGVKADWDVDVWALQTMTGYELMLNGYNVTPEAGLRYVHIKQDSYIDTAGQKISADDADVLTGVIGAKVAKTYALNNGMLLTPELRGALTYDLSQDDVAATVTLPNGSAYNVNGDALDEFGIELGAGVKAEINDRMELSVGYEGKFREDYQDHSGLLNMKYKF